MGSPANKNEAKQEANIKRLRFFAFKIRNSLFYTHHI